VTVASLLMRGRRRAESLMPDTCTIQRVTGTSTDPVTGVDTPTYSDEYAGRCKVQTFEPFERTPESGGHTYTEQRYSVHIPVASYAPRVGDLVTITAAAYDENLTGRAYRIVALLHKSTPTAYRLAVTDQVA
jgi:hypothetical protein